MALTQPDSRLRTTPRCHCIAPTGVHRSWPVAADERHTYAHRRMDICSRGIARCYSTDGNAYCASGQVRVAKNASCRRASWGIPMGRRKGRTPAATGTDMWDPDQVGGTNTSMAATAKGICIGCLATDTLSPHNGPDQSHRADHVMVEKDGQEQQTLCRMGACTICFDISQDHVDAYLYRKGLPFLPSLTPATERHGVIKRSDCPAGTSRANRAD